MSQAFFTFYGDDINILFEKHNHPLVLFDRSSFGKVEAFHVYLKVANAELCKTADNSTSILTVHNSEVLFVNTIFKNIRLPSLDINSSAVLTSISSYIFITNCSFYNNSARLGNIAARESQLAVNQTRFSWTHAYLGGGLSLSNNTDARVEECYFMNNEATYSGAIYAEFNTSVVVSKSQFISNKAI